MTLPDILAVLVNFGGRTFTRTCGTDGWLQYRDVLVRLVRGIFTRTCGTEGAAGVGGPSMSVSPKNRAFL